jgi:hypothetical protein
VPYNALGVWGAPVGGNAGVFGISGTSFADINQPGRLNGQLTRIQLVGKNSPNSSTLLYQNDWNNFAPALGLSWSLPWLGKDKTVLRVGYSVGYERPTPIQTDNNVGGTPPGVQTTRVLTAATYLNLTNVTVPLTPTEQPLQTIPLTQRTQSLGVFDYNRVIPYTQNFNVSLQRDLGRNMSFEVRYVGSKGTKLLRGLDVNEVNIFESGILEAFQVTQAGGNAPLFDRMLNGLTINAGTNAALGQGVVNGTTVTGSAALRQNANTRAFFANNNVGGLANFINTTTAFTGVAGGLIRRAGLPENLIVANPQFVNVNYYCTCSNSTYHSLQLDFNKRFGSGWTLNSNYTWSRALGDAEGNLDAYTRNGRNRGLDKRLLNFHRTHVMRGSGTWELPFGPGKAWLKSSHGVLSRLVEQWQFGGILNVLSGAPLSISSLTTSLNQFTTTTTPTLTGQLDKGFGQVTKVANGVVYFSGLTQVADPSTARLTTLQTLNTASAMRALADSNGNVILVNATPGTAGSLAPNYLSGPGAFGMDLNLVKRFRISERVNFEFRLDAINALNHPVFGNPVTNINNTSFGRITTATGNRVLVLNGRISF